MVSERAVQIFRLVSLVDVVVAIVVMVAGLWMFISNSIVQLGHLPSLIPYMFTQRMGYLIFLCAYWG